jgi:ribosome biogenesis GTPase
MTEHDELRRGLVVRFEGGFYTVAAAGESLLCTLVKRLRRGARSATNPLAVGDEVGFRTVGGGEGVVEQGLIEQIHERRNELARTAPGRDALKHVLVANLDLLLVVTALRSPPPNLARLDRFTVISEQADIPTAIVVTKVDEGTPAEARLLFAPYPVVGYPLLLTSATTGDGIAELRALLKDKISAVVGSSGVGKSTLLNAMQPGLQLRAGELGERTGKGRHTTTVAELIPLDEGGYVADTPGLRGIEPYELDPELLDEFFPEMRPLRDLCRFSPCSHLHEPGCAVRAAVEAGAIAQSRYDSYVKLHDEARQNARPSWAR